MAYRITINQTIQETPYFLLYGRDPILPGDLVFNVRRKEKPDETDDKLNYKIDLLKRLRDGYEAVQARQGKAMEYYKEKYDLRHKSMNLEIGDLALIYWPVPKRGFTQKLMPKWQGPYKVVAKISPYTYRMERNGITMAVHVQRLRKYTPLENDQKNQVKFLQLYFNFITTLFFLLFYFILFILID